MAVRTTGPNTLIGMLSTLHFPAATGASNEASPTLSCTIGLASQVASGVAVPLMLAMFPWRMDSLPGETMLTSAGGLPGEQEEHQSNANESHFNDSRCWRRKQGFVTSGVSDPGREAGPSLTEMSRDRMTRHRSPSFEITAPLN